MGQKEKSLLFFLLNLFVIFKTILNVVLINVDIRSGSRSDKKKKSRRESKHGKRISEPTQRCHKTAVSGFIPEILFMTCDGHFHQEFFFFCAILELSALTMLSGRHCCSFMDVWSCTLQSFEIHEGVRINQKVDWHMPSA